MFLTMVSTQTSLGGDNRSLFGTNAGAVTNHPLVSGGTNSNTQAHQQTLTKQH